MQYLCVHLVKPAADVHVISGITVRMSNECCSRQRESTDYVPLSCLGQKVSGQCQTELFDLKQQLMADYEINPNIVAMCDVEIAKHCHRGTEREGKTLDCLMALAEEEDEGDNNKIRQQCFDAVSVTDTEIQ